MPPFGRTYQPFIVLLGVWIVVVLTSVAVLTGASRATVRRALLGGAGAALVNACLDALAHHQGWWRYPGATTPFGPVVYYVESGLGFAVFALVSRWLFTRYGSIALFALVGFLCAYGAARDHVTQELTGLIVFERGAGIVVLDALFEWAIPYGVAVAIAGVGRNER